MSSVDPNFPADAESVASGVPGGWVYKIHGKFGPDEAVPPYCVIGAWKVDKDGEITGDFIINPNFDSFRCGRVARSEALRRPWSSAIRGAGCENSDRTL